MTTPMSSGTGLFLEGQRESGEDVRISNVTAAVAVANIVKSSLGPVGLDKMLVDDIGDVLITNDGSTILQQLEVEHPAARVLVDLARLQDSEVGDGTTSVVLIAAELLKKGNELMRSGNIHPTTIIAGYRAALKAAVAYIKKELVVTVDSLSEEHLLSAAKTSMSSKILGKEADYFSRMAVDAVKSVRVVAGKKAGSSSSDAPPTTANSTTDKAAKTTMTNGTATNSTTTHAPSPRGVESGGEATPKNSSSTAKKIRYKYPISAIHILKAHGKSSLDSHLVKNGFALNAIRAAQGMPTSVGTDDDKPVKIALLDLNLQRHRMAMGVQVIIQDPKEVEKIKQREMDITKERIHKILRAGANVVLTTKGIDDLCLKYFVEAGVMCARRCAREDLKRLAKATGGRLVTTMADMEGNETFESECLGVCEKVVEERVGDGHMLYMYGCEGGGASNAAGDTELEEDMSGGASTIVLRGANDYMLDEMDRSLHDSLCVVKRMLESNTLVAGGGAVEASLSVYLEAFSTTLDSREQLAIQEYADALLVVPKTLVVNAAKDSSDLVAKLRAAHSRCQRDGGEEDEKAALKYTGLDLHEGVVRDSLLAGVVEPAISKIKSLRFATEAAITILRIDDRIQIQPQGGGQG